MCILLNKHCKKKKDLQYVSLNLQILLGVGPSYKVIKLNCFALHLSVEAKMCTDFSLF